MKLFSIVRFWQKSEAKAKSTRAKGTSLLECIISLQILGIATLGVANAFVTHMSINSSTEQKSGAVLAAQQVVDAMRAEAISTLPSCSR